MGRTIRRILSVIPAVAVQVLVLLVLPALLILCDGVICKTTHGMRHLSGMKKQEVSL